MNGRMLIGLAAGVHGLLAAGVVNAQPAPHQPPCEAREALVAHLATQFGEHPRHGGTVGPGTRFEVFVANHGAWSVVMHFPNGRSCVMAVGTGWAELGGRT